MGQCRGSEVTISKGYPWENVEHMSAVSRIPGNWAFVLLSCRSLTEGDPRVGLPTLFCSAVLTERQLRFSKGLSKTFDKSIGPLET